MVWNVQTSLPVRTSIGADVAGSRSVSLVGRRAENQQIFEHAAGRGGLHQRQLFGIAAQSFFQIDRAVLAERCVIDLPVRASIARRMWLAAKSRRRSVRSLLSQ